MENMTIYEAYTQYMNFVKVKNKPQSYRTINSRFKSYILPYFKDILVKDLKSFDYLEWQKIIEEKNLSYKYKKSLHYTMVSLLNYCINFYNLEINIASKVGNFKNNSPYDQKISVWTIEEYSKFINKVKDIKYKFLFDFLFFTGCRLGEALALNFNDFEDNTININKTISKEYINGKRLITSPKTKKSIRRIHIDGRLSAELNQLKDYYTTKFGYFNNNFYIFGGKNPLAPTTIERWKNKCCDLAFVKRIRIHDFRHSHASILLSNKIPITIISNRLGHSNVSMTLDVYSHFMPEDEKRVIATLDSLHNCL